MGAQVPVLVLGASGMLGRVLHELLPRDPRMVVTGLSRADLDIGDAKAVAEAVARARPSLVFNCAAYTDVDGCERDPGRARRDNAEAAGHVARAAAALGAVLVHVSTDFVFDGTARIPYKESDAPNPLSEYGRSKLEGERLVASLAPRHLIVRTAWTFGRRPQPDFVRKILERADRGEPLSVVDDQVGSPTYVRDLAAGLLGLVKEGAQGVFHLTNAGTCSRHELARAILDMSGRGAVPVAAATTEARPLVAPRPAYSVLDTGKFERRTGMRPRPWREALADYLVEMSRGDA